MQKDMVCNVAEIGTGQKPVVALSQKLKQKSKFIHKRYFI